MSDTTPELPNMPQAKSHKQRFVAIWLIPIFAAFLAAYLGLHSYAQHGPLITVSFKTADGIVPGQTQLRYKAVALGTVESVQFNHDFSDVLVSIRMASSAKPLLTNHARIWVARPHLNAINTSDLESLVSGAYIQIDPGAPDGETQYAFTGLENAPMDRADQAGRNFVLTAPRLGSLTAGSPVFYRGIEVGEVLGYDSGNGFDPITVTVFIHSPYDQVVHAHSEFWNASGLSLSVGAGGIHLATNSLRAVLAGGVSFITPPSAQHEEEAAAGSSFALHDSEQQAEDAQYVTRIPMISYFENSVQDLGAGSPVMIYGIQVGSVTGVRLVYDPQTNIAKVRVAFEIQPDRVFGPTSQPNPAEIMQHLVEKGMRVKQESSNILLGQKMLTLQFQPDAPATEIAKEDGVMVMPVQTGSGGNVMDALGDVANKLNQIPFEQIGDNLNHLLANANALVGSKDAANTLHDLSTTMTNLADLSQKADKNLTPALQKLPEISAQLQGTLAHANDLMSGLNHNYGTDSDFPRDAKRVLDQVNDAARSIRLLADFLERHPESILTGKPAEPEKDKP